jgi:hypothetical protein
MKPNPTLPKVKIRGMEISVQLTHQPVLVFSSDLPARRHIQDCGYSEKGWLWCAFQEALLNQKVKLANPLAVFEAIWEKLQSERPSRNGNCPSLCDG